MKRRVFITLLGGAAAWPLAASAQQGSGVRRIGILMAYAESDREYQSHLAAFREELQKLGWTESRNVQINYRWAALDPASMRRFARELIALQTYPLVELTYHGVAASRNAQHPHHFC